MIFHNPPTGRRRKARIPAVSPGPWPKGYKAARMRVWPELLRIMKHKDQKCNGKISERVAVLLVSAPEGKGKARRHKGKFTLEVCVSKKLPSHRWFERLTIKGMSIKVTETGRINAFDTFHDIRKNRSMDAAAAGTSRKTRLRPFPMGVSIGHPEITAGTAGWIVYKRAGGYKRVLSNNHVLANRNDAEYGDEIWQPGSYDGGSSVDTVGILTEYIPILWGQWTNRYDAALMAPVPEDIASEEILGWGSPPVDIREEVAVGDWTYKSGRTTGVRSRRVTQIAVVARVWYSDEKWAGFIDQIYTCCFQGAGGDSGSLGIWAGPGNDMHINKAFGLLFAGNAYSGAILFCPIAGIMEEMQIAPSKYRRIATWWKNNWLHILVRAVKETAHYLYHICITCCDYYAMYGEYPLPDIVSPCCDDETCGFACEAWGLYACDCVTFECEHCYGDYAVNGCADSISTFCGDSDEAKFCNWTLCGTRGGIQYICCCYSYASDNCGIT